MKKHIIFFALLSFGFGSSAQSRFKQASFTEMFMEYSRDSEAFFINRLSEDFAYTNPQGRFHRKADVAKIGTQTEVTLIGAQNIISTIQGINKMLDHILANDILNPTIHQSGDLAVVSGRHKTTWVLNNGKEITGDVAGTYTFQKKKGKWMFVAAQQTGLAE